MNDENQSYESPVSCVWPLVTVLGALLLVNLVQLVSIVKERQAVSQTTGQAAQAIARYKTVSDKLENLAKDLMQAKVSLQVPSPTQRTRTPPLRAVYFGEGRKLISTKGYASALEWSKADVNMYRIR